MKGYLSQSKLSVKRKKAEPMNDEEELWQQGSLLFNIFMCGLYFALRSGK